MNNTNKVLAANEYELIKERTTIGLKMITKERLDKNRAPGQCYDGFIWQLVDLWEKTNSDDGTDSVISTAGENQGAYRFSHSR